MENFTIQRRRGRRKSVSFNPSHQFIAESVEAYLRGGGQITRIERINGNYESFVALNELASADDFLFDR
jgi:hypothetical protein